MARGLIPTHSNNAELLFLRHFNIHVMFGGGLGLFIMVKAPSKN